MSRPMVSLLVTAYNVEKYLDECLSSLIGQSLRDIEIIIVNDGSTDRSRDIAEKYSASDNRVSLINTENRGVGAARNTLTKLAGGEYSVFIDADDYLEPETIETVYTAANKLKCDITIYNGRAFVDNGAEYVYKQKKYFRLGKKNENIVLTGLEYLEQTGGTIQQPCMKMFNTHFLQNNKFHHPEGNIAGSDAIFFYQSMIKAEKVTYVDFAGYYRRYRPGSLVTNQGIKGTRDRIRNFNLLISLVSAVTQERHKKVLNNQFALYACLLWVLAMGRKNREDRKQLLMDFYESNLDTFIRYNRRGVVQTAICALMALPPFLNTLKTLACVLIRTVFKSKSRLFV